MRNSDDRCSDYSRSARSPALLSMWSRCPRWKEVLHNVRRAYVMESLTAFRDTCDPCDVDVKLRIDVRLMFLRTTARQSLDFGRHELTIRVLGFDLPAREVRAVLDVEKSGKATLVAAVE